MSRKSILFVNQSSGYLMIDIINAHATHYDELVLFTGFLNPRETPLDSKVKVKMGVTYQRSSGLKRLLTWIGFWLQSLWFVFIKYRKHKLYLVSNPPLNIFTANWAQREIALLVYDIYPDALAKNKIISHTSWLFKFWEKTNQKVYKKAIKIFTLSNGMATALKVPDEYSAKLHVVPVWTNNTFFQPIDEKNNEFIKSYKLQNKFIVSYSGNLGKTHPVEKLIELAQELVDNEDILFLIIGEGDKKAQLLEQQKKLQLPNLKILDFQPTALFPHVLAAANIGVVTLEADAADLSVPSKTYNLMSAGKPIMTIAKDTSELAQIVESNGIGANFAENELQEMKAFIVELKNDKKRYGNMQEKSKTASLLYSPENAKKMILH